MASSSSSASSVKYPYPVEVNPRHFVSVSLSKQNYFVWKKEMLRLFEVQGLIGFINGKVLEPAKKITVPVTGDDDSSIDNGMKEIENKDYQDWKRSDALLQRWIIGTINEDVLPHVECLKTAKDMWSKLIILREGKMEYANRPVDINVANFVPIKLSSDNYSSWKSLMLRFIERQGMLGFINGEVTKSAVSDNDDDNNDEWRKSDELLQIWIKKTINEDILRELVLLETSKDIWERLNIILNETNIVYPYPIEVNVGDFVPFKLSGSNYVLWRRLMLRLFEKQGLLGFILKQHQDNNMIIIPPYDSLAWKRADELMQSWIIRTINEHLLAHVVDTKTASEMWAKLETAFTSEDSSTQTVIVYPYPIEVNVGDFVPFKLSGSSNYVMWRKLMLHLFEKQGLLGFILQQHQGNNMIIIPPYDSLAWKRTDELLQSWIIRTINENFLAHVVNTKTASEMWAKLETAFTSEDSSTQTVIEYPYPVDVNVGDFVPIKLSRENFPLWAKLMHRLIFRQGLVGFIDGKVRAPPRRIKIADENPDYKAWKKTDELLQSWIMRTIDQKDLFASLLDLETAQQIWIKLHKVFFYEYIHGSTETEREEEEDAIRQYLPLHKAALTGDWKRAKEFIQQKPDAVRAFITRTNETTLMIAVRSKKGNPFVKKLLELMSPDDVALRDNILGRTALHYAAMAGNTEAAKLLVDKNPDLPNYYDSKGYSALFGAAVYGRKETVLYLLDVTKDNIHPNLKPFEGEKGCTLVRSLIVSGLYDTALLLIRRYPKMAWEQQSYPALQIIAINCSSAFKSGAHLNWWQRLIFSYVPTKLEGAYQSCGGDVENPINISFLSVPQIREIKLKHEEALELVKHLCSESLKLNNSKVKEMIQKSLVLAANSGIPEIVEEIIEVFPELVYHLNEMRQNIFHIAILNRCEDVFNLIYQFREEVRTLILAERDSNGKSCLDLVLDLKKEQKINLRASAAGAALQMQCELQWFKEVEKHTIDYYKGYRTKEMTTSGTIYTETHEELVKEGEKWMKDTATSCTIIATLVATVVFAAVISVPGGNNDFGIPNLFQDKAFTFFIIADTISLFSSISSLVMFLAILTSRYSVMDFLFKLPNRLIIGLLFLFVSITSMMIAFAATLYLLFEHKGAWILFPIIGLSFFPVTVFVYSQFPLLWDMMTSTYGPGIFRQQSDRILF